MMIEVVRVAINFEVVFSVSTFTELLPSKNHTEGMDRDIATI